MRQDDMDKLVKRFNNVVREMLPADADFKIVLIAAERVDGGAEMTVGTIEGDHLIASQLCEVAAKMFTRKVREDRQATMNRILSILSRALDEGTLVDIMQDILRREAEDEKDDQQATKH